MYPLIEALVQTAAPAWPTLRWLLESLWSWPLALALVPIRTI